MKNFKKIMLTGALTLATVFTIQVVSNAATVKVTGEVVNIRKEASTDSKVVAQLSENVECEYLGEEGNWYKVKYQRYTGYVSKEYTKLIGETANTATNTENNQANNNQENSQSNNSSNNQNNTNTNDTQTTNSENNLVNNQSATNSEQTNNAQSSNSQEEEPKLIYKKFNQKATIKILPLIHSTNIGDAQKDDEVLILTETSGWSYIQTDEINGWVRTDTLGQATTKTYSSSSDQGTTTEPTEKIGYISEEEVNMRKGAGTSYSIVKVLTLNTQVTILKEEGKWYQVKAGDSTGYVSKAYVSDSKSVTNRSLTEPRTANEKSAENNEDNNATSKTVSNTTASSKVDNDKEKNSESTSTTNKGTNTVATSNKNNSSTNEKETNSKDTTKGTDVIAYAKKFMGVPYVWGGASKSRI